MRYGYKASAEQFPPRRLLDLAVAAERAGFESVWTSDHFQPWRHTDGHAPNALVWLGAAAQATERVTLGTSVLTPSFRYNPAVVAQAFATLGCLAPGRVILGVGTGESLNEIPVGIDWPEQSERFARLKESVTLIQQLFREDFVTFEGEYYRTHDATIYDRPDAAGPDLHRGLGPGRGAARRADRRRADLHVGQGRRALHRDAPACVEEGAAKAGRDASGLGRMIEMKVSFDTDRARAMEDTKIWAALALPGEQKSASRTRARWSGWRRPSRTSPTGAGSCRPTPTSTSSRSRPTSTTASTTSSSTSRATTRKRRSPATGS